MAVPTQERRGERLVARVSGTDGLLFQRAASLEGRSVATCVSPHAREMARRIIADQGTTEPDAVQSRCFVKALSNSEPSDPNRLNPAISHSGLPVSLAPDFSPVVADEHDENRFNGFSHRVKAAEAAGDGFCHDSPGGSPGLMK